MIRYTIEAKKLVGGLGIQSIRDHIERELVKKIKLFKTELIFEHQNTGLLLIETELQADEMSRILNDIKRSKNIELLEAKLGWVIPYQFASLVKFNLKKLDPYLSTNETQENEEYYKYSKNGQLLILIYLILLAVSIAILYFGLVSSDNVQSYIGVVFSCLFIGSLLLSLLYIRCNDNGIEFKYLIGRKTLQWSEIQSIKIFEARGSWCTLVGYETKISFPLSFFYDQSTENKLIKTILTKALLVLVESSSQQAIYGKARTVI